MNFIGNRMGANRDGFDILAADFLPQCSSHKARAMVLLEGVWFLRQVSLYSLREFPLPCGGELPLPITIECDSSERQRGPPQPEI